MPKALVLLSGGLDSAAALFLAIRYWPSTEAVFFDYGQPAAARERAAATRLAKATGTTLYQRDIPAVFKESRAGIFNAPASDTDKLGRDTAFLPCRNLILLSLAASLACERWPDTGIDLVVGFNAGDAAGFPDCRRLFCDAATLAINRGNGTALVTVRTPWIDRSKSAIVEWVKTTLPERFELLRESWSCYAAAGPCGACTACKTRAAALG